ncbi:MAG: orotidine-5'-phosphate decarboxylase [Candidatus Azotimanducaceae bacterium]|jgi:orotidine-5'-phosphate decarboxylase
MKNSFITRWHEVRERKQSNIVAGLDPAVFGMGRGDTGLPEEADLLEWALAFIEAVAPFVSMIKPNQAYFQGVEQRQILKTIVEKIHSKDLLALSDNKIADIGSTNASWIFYNKELGFDAMTCAPYAGNIEEAIREAHAQNIGMMSMGLMSNTEYKTEMNYIDADTGEQLWKSRVRRACEARADAIVVGGTYTKSDPEFMEFVELTNESEALYLIPGIGAQGGTVENFLASGIDPRKCMINSGRRVMFPNGSASKPEEQAIAAKALRDSFNNSVKK